VKNTHLLGLLPIFDYSLFPEFFSGGYKSNSEEGQEKKEKGEGPQEGEKKITNEKRGPIEREGILTQRCV